MNWYLFPFAPLYRFVVYIRNKLFDLKIKESKTFNHAIISIGNITVGGTGKTPHTEYIISLLKDKFKVATLSRGYKRKTKGYLEARLSSTVAEIGDEPLQIKKKFPEITVSVDEKRVNGVEQLLSKKDKPDVILLDDAFQHRYIKPGLSILLIDYNRPITKDFLLPVGRLREPAHNSSRANIIIVTKCPETLLPIDFRILAKEFNPYPYQDLFFTSFTYKQLVPVFAKGKGKKLEDLDGFTALVVSGIANPKMIYSKLKDSGIKVVKSEFSDHHMFAASDLKKIHDQFNKIKDSNKVILCTEKDAIRLNSISENKAVQKLPIYYMPIEVNFLNGGEKDFNNVVKKYLRRFVS